MEEQLNPGMSTGGKLKRRDLATFYRLHGNELSCLQLLSKNTLKRNGETWEDNERFHPIRAWSNLKDQKGVIWGIKIVRAPAGIGWEME